MVIKTYPGLQDLQRHKFYLQDFWREVGGLEVRWNQCPLGKDKTLSLIQEMGSVHLSYYSKTQTRETWDAKKNKVKKFTKFKACFGCGGPPSVRHHIIWLSRGGRNQKNNIVALCRPCHAEIHPWLKKYL